MWYTEYMKTLFIILMLSFTSAEASEWQIASNTLLVADWLQTLQIVERRSDGYYETNPILGDYPNRGSVNLYFLMAITLNNLIGKDLGDGWYMGVTVVQIGAVGHNFQAGLTLGF